MSQFEYSILTPLTSLTPVTLSIVTTVTLNKSEIRTVSSGTVVGTIRTGDQELILSSLSAGDFVSTNLISGDFIKINDQNLEIINVTNLANNPDITGVETIQINFTSVYNGVNILNGSLSNFTTYNVGRALIDQSELIITYPNISENTPITLPLHPNPLTTLGENYTFTVDNNENLSNLLDGVYKFTYNLYKDEVLISTITKYFVQDQGVQSCLRKKIDLIIDKQCSDDHEEIGIINAILDTAKRFASEDKFIEGQELMDYVIDKCNGC